MNHASRAAAGWTPLAPAPARATSAERPTATVAVQSVLRDTGTGLS
ncbi:hypothetical protein [Promicromonospora sp. NFX87]